MDELSVLKLDRAGREYIHLTFAELPDDVQAVHARVGDGDWNPCEKQTTTEWRILMRGPNAPTSPGYLVGQSGRLEVRVTDAPEVVIRRAAYIQLT